VTNMIEVRDLCKSYGSFQALSGVSFDVRRGEILGFLGPNGAGKTTAMKIMTGFIYPSAGSVTVGGMDVVERSLDVRKMIGYQPEHNPLYPDLTVAEYLGFCAQLRDLGSARARERIDAVIGLCSLEPKRRAPIRTLSKGYRQRVGIAQALLHEPDVLILDEPTVGLDPNQVVPIRDIIRDVGKERTVILCSHILPEVEAVCARVVIIAEGRIVGDGAPRELAERHLPGRNASLEDVFRLLTGMKAGVAS
jgi:ABC-2 type transport system ATP-binding protein